MRIAGFEKNSFVDYPGKIAAAIFTQGCNFNCFYCHNSELIPLENDSMIYDNKRIFEFLVRRKGLLDGVVVTGGEPTIQCDIKQFIEKIKSIGYEVKLDTNGTNPDVIRTLINDNLIDYIAMDIKAPLERYSEICCTTVNLKNINTSIDILMENKIDYEFRTTFAPQLTKEDIILILNRIKGAKKYVLQQYRKPNKKNKPIDKRLLEFPHSPNFIKNIATIAQSYVEHCETRGC